MTEEQQKKWGKLLQAVQADDGLRQRLVSDTATVLKQQGLEPPPGYRVQIVENTDKVIHMVLPPKQKGAELSEKDLERVAGGATAGGGASIAPWSQPWGRM